MGALPGPTPPPHHDRSRATRRAVRVVGVRRTARRARPASRGRRDLATGRRGDDLQFGPHVVPARGAGRHRRKRIPGHRGDGYAVRPRLAAVGSPGGAARRGPGPGARALRPLRTGLPRRECQRPARRGGAGTQERSPPRGLDQHAHRLHGGLPRVGFGAVRARVRHTRLAVARIPPLGARVRPGQHRSGPEPLPHARHSGRPGGRHRGARGARGGGGGAWAA